MVAATGNSLQMYDTSCSYQAALDLKRMSSGGGMTGVTGPMTSSAVGMNPFAIKTEECNGNDWTTGCTYRLPTIACGGMSTFEQLKQSVEKAKAVLTAEARDTRNYFSASFSALPSVGMGMGMNFGSHATTGGGNQSLTTSTRSDLNLVDHHTHHHHLHHPHSSSSLNTHHEDRLAIEIASSTSSSDKRANSSSSNTTNNGVESPPSGVKGSSNNSVYNSSAPSATSSSSAESNPTPNNGNNNNGRNLNSKSGKDDFPILVF
ncbi:unnamed protein product [Allacma fusca]|uniref:Uncharacterized protein n=1 Tax=Allacma fusca TaxID=39272 RepID=A0A8J2L5K4_9HEXA|nr:unnamed protein product [Allacma fusca]